MSVQPHVSPTWTPQIFQLGQIPIETRIRDTNGNSKNRRRNAQLMSALNIIKPNVCVCVCDCHALCLSRRLDGPSWKEKQKASCTRSKAFGIVWKVWNQVLVLPVSVSALASLCPTFLCCRFFRCHVDLLQRANQMIIVNS